MVAELTYLTLLTVFIILPTFVIIIRNIKTVSEYKLVVFSSFIILPSSLLWDYLSILNGVWYFENIIGVWAFGLPIEEILFMISLTTFVSSLTLIILKR